MVFKTDYHLMQVKSIAEGEHSALLSTFIKLSFAIKIFALSIFECPLKTGFTVSIACKCYHRHSRQSIIGPGISYKEKKEETDLKTSNDYAR